jgi:hypothetical protein
MSKSSKTKIKVPKRVAGVKIPKVVRKGPVLQFVNSTAGRTLIAEALTAAMGVLAYKQTGDGTREKIKDKARDTGEALAQNTARLTHAFGEGVRAFREALAADETEAGDRDTTDAADESGAGEVAREPPKKNSRRSVATPNPL